MFLGKIGDAVGKRENISSFHSKSLHTIVKHKLAATYCLVLQKRTPMAGANKIRLKQIPWAFCAGQFSLVKFSDTHVELVVELTCGLISADTHTNTPLALLNNRYQAGDDTA